MVVLIALFSARRSDADPARRERVSIVVPRAVPEGFDEKRLVERVRVYLDSMGVDAISARSGTPGGPADARFVLELRWPEANMTPLEGVVHDTSARPVRRYSFDIGFAGSWPEFERLVALKLRSALRIAIAEQAELAAFAPDAATATGPRTEAASRQRARFVFDLSGAAKLGDASDRLQPAGATRLALGLSDWAFGIAATLAVPPARGGAASSSDVIEGSLAASLRYDLLNAEESRGVVELGADAGVFVARVSAEQAGEQRMAYALSPLASASVLGGYRLLEGGSVAVLGGLSADWLLTRSEVTAGGNSLYDSGRFRYGLKLGLRFVF